MLASACSALLDTSSLGPGNEVAGSSGAASTGNGGSLGGSGATSGAEPLGGATGASAGASGASAGASGATAGASAGGAPNGCKPNDKDELCDGIDNDCDASTNDVCPTGCKGFVAQGVGHMACENKVAFSFAQLTCLKQSMNVVAVNDASENAEMLEQGKALGDFIWLGAQDQQKNYTLSWPDGTVIATNGVAMPGVYNDFASGQPSGQGEYCLHMETNTNGAEGTWSSTSCTGTAPFICEPLF